MGKQKGIGYIERHDLHGERDLRCSHVFPEERMDILVPFLFGHLFSSFAAVHLSSLLSPKCHNLMFSMSINLLGPQPHKAGMGNIRGSRGTFLSLIRIEHKFHYPFPVNFFHFGKRRKHFCFFKDEGVYVKEFE